MYFLIEKDFSFMEENMMTQRETDMRFDYEKLFHMIHRNKHTIVFSIKVLMF